MNTMAFMCLHTDTHHTHTEAYTTTVFIEISEERLEVNEGGTWTDGNKWQEVLGGGESHWKSSEATAALQMGREGMYKKCQKVTDDKCMLSLQVTVIILALAMSEVGGASSIYVHLITGEEQAGSRKASYKSTSLIHK